MASLEQIKKDILATNIKAIANIENEINEYYKKINDATRMINFLKDQSEQLDPDHELNENNGFNIIVNDLEVKNINLKEVDLAGYPDKNGSYLKKLKFIENKLPGRMYSAEELFELLKPYETKMKSINMIKWLTYIKRLQNNDPVRFKEMYKSTKHVIELRDKRMKDHLDKFFNRLEINMKNYVRKGEAYSLTHAKTNYYSTNESLYKEMLKSKNKSKVLVKD